MYLGFYARNHPTSSTAAIQGTRTERTGTTQKYSETQTKGTGRVGKLKINPNKFGFPTTSHHCPELLVAKRMLNKYE